MELGGKLPIIPIMVPKFYLDLWNLACSSRVEYPSLSTEAATGMPIEIFIGKNRKPPGWSLCCFSKRLTVYLFPRASSPGQQKIWTTG